MVPLRVRRAPPSAAPPGSSPTLWQSDARMVPRRSRPPRFSFAVSPDKCLFLVGEIYTGD